MGARFFSPDYGSYVQEDYLRDALGDVDLANDPLTGTRYGLAGGNPINFVETDGHSVCPSIFKLWNGNGMTTEWTRVHRYDISRGCMGRRQAAYQRLLGCEPDYIYGNYCNAEYWKYDLAFAKGCHGFWGCVWSIGGLLSFLPVPEIEVGAAARGLLGGLRASKGVRWGSRAIRSARAITRVLRGGLKTDPGQAIFYSGKVGGERVAWRYAEAEADAHGGTTLGSLLKSRGISIPDHGKIAYKAWEVASKKFAEGASGTVRVVLGDEVDASSIWLRIELKALKRNPRVTRIIKIDAATGRRTTLFAR
jgi:hypothetical protein